MISALAALVLAVTVGTSACPLKVFGVLYDGTGVFAYVENPTHQGMTLTRVMVGQYVDKLGISASKLSDAPTCNGYALDSHSDNGDRVAHTVCYNVHAEVAPLAISRVKINYAGDPGDVSSLAKAVTCQ